MVEIKNAEKITPEFIKEWTRRVENELEIIGPRFDRPEDNFYFFNTEDVDRKKVVGDGIDKATISKLLDFIITKAFKETIISFGMCDNWVMASHKQKGYDSTFYLQQIEHKFSLCDSGFTGNVHSYEKSPLYLMGKLSIKQNKVIGLFLAFLNLGECTKSNWTHKSVTEAQRAESSKRCGISTLKIHSDDVRCYQILHGALKINPVWIRELPQPVGHNGTK
jgi:hypothetical protein